MATYTPVPSVTPYLLSDKFQSFIVGPVGSTKTTASLMKIPIEAKKMAPCVDGIRRSRCAVVRNTRQMLLDSTIKDFINLFPEGIAGDYSRTELKFTMKFDDVECEILFRGLDDSNDVRRLLSLQLSFAMVDEVREINPDVFNALTGRLGRYPNGMLVPHREEWGVDEKGNPIQGCVDDNGVQMKKVWGATNPADADSFWEDYISNADPEKVHVTIQPSGRSPDADWVKHLPSNYYEDLMVGKSEDWISVYVDGEWGRSLSGKPVFRCFNPETHVAKEIPNVLSSGLIIGVDAGLNPSATIGQIAYDGRLIIHDAITGNAEGMGAKRFIAEKLKPLLANKFPGLPSVVIIDPAAFQRAQTDERSVADIFKAEKFKVLPAKTNSIAARLAACEAFMTKTIGDKPALLVSPEASLLISAWKGKYKYKINTKGETDDKPEKSHPWSDIADSAQYLCLHADGGALFGQNHQSRRVEVKPYPRRWGCR